MDEKSVETPITKTAPPEKSGKSDIYSAIFDWVEMFVAAFTVVILLITFVGRYSPVIGSSMYPTLHENDILIMSKLGYTPKQGDIVVFQIPDFYEEPFVKRVIATGGQTIDIDFETWTVTVDGVALEEDYVNREELKSMNGSSFEFPLTVPEGEIFVMGDNRNHSTDSRDYRVGTVDVRCLTGHVLLRIFPFDRFTTL